MGNHPKVFALLPLEIGYAREVARGIQSWAANHSRWLLRIGSVPRDARLYMQIKPEPDGGAILFLGSEAHERCVLEHYPAPAVNVSHRSIDSLLPRVLPDNWEAGRRAARHLIDRGFTQFASHLTAGNGYGRARNTGFVEALREAGHDCMNIPLGGAKTADWLVATPKPVAIFAVDKVRTRYLYDACYVQNIVIPEQVAIVGVDNDETYCNSQTPSLSSVDTRGYAVGFRAASLLDELMRGATPPTGTDVVPCGEVIVRRSTDTIAIDDEQLRIAVRFIREHACDGLQVNDVLDRLTISRRTLEQRFRSIFKRTPHDEIRRVQLERAKQLLHETDLLIPTIGKRCGFCDGFAFTKAFRKAFGKPPSYFRREMRQFRVSPS